MAGRARKRKKRRFCAWLTRILCAVTLVASVATVLIGIVLGTAFERSLPDRFFGLTAKGIAPRFYAYDFSDRSNRIGKEYALGEEFFSQKSSIYVPYTELPTHLIDAFVAIEDKRFYEHQGVDWYRTLGAGANYFLGFSKNFGASTITQQLVKNLTGDADVSPRRKLQEIFYALDLERKMDKSEIMELYLNVIHFAEHCDGIGAAAEHYFSKSVKELNLAESATLAAIINNPSYYNPIRHPEHNLERRNIILRQMYEQGRIDDGIYQSARATPLELKVSESKTDGISSWYADMVIEDVIKDLCREHGMSRSAASGLVYSGGLRIDTALDERTQKTVEDYYEKELRLPINQKGQSAQSAILVLDSRTGDVLGVAGAVGEKKGNRVQNFATQTLRPPGSVIKPITVYAPSLEQGIISWATVVDDTPTEFDGPQGRLWPRNAAGGYRGLTDIADAIARSTNTVSVKVLQKLGVDRSFLIAKEQFGLKNLYHADGITDRDLAALALGQLNYGVTLRELVGAYSVFADLGVHHEPRSYYRVLDADGNVLLSRTEGGEIVMSAGNAAVMTKMLQGVISRGTASSVTLDSICECAGKTGTTGHDCDRWFVGYTPDVICGVWCGFEYPEPMTGKNACLSIWDTVMHRLLLQGGGRRHFEIPSSLVRVSYCKDSGALPVEACTMDARGDRRAVGWFVKGTEPKSTCQCHVPCQYDEEQGGISHGHCPHESCRSISLVRVERNFPRQVTVADAEYVWGGDPLTVLPNPNQSESYFSKNKSGFSGKSGKPRPFNRSCPMHLEPMVKEEKSEEEKPWWQRYSLPGVLRPRE